MCRLVESTATEPSASPGAMPRWVLLAVAALLTLHFALAVGSKLNESTTTDEIVHLTGGVSYWQKQDFRLHPENGILPMRWAAIPAWLQGAAFPRLDGNDYWRLQDAWVIGHQFFYETGEDHFPRLMAGRAMIAVFSVGTGLLVFLWSNQLFGYRGALISLTFFSFCPDFLAHGALVTSDVCMAFFFVAAAGAWWRHLHDSKALNWWLSALTLGLAFVAKYSAFLLLPVMLVTAAARVAAPEPMVFSRRHFTTARGKATVIFFTMLGHGAVAILVVWAFYGFRYQATNPALPPAEIFDRLFTSMESQLGALTVPVHVARTLHLLPEAYLYGFVYVLVSVAERAAFLNGQYSLVGWPTFFLWTFLFKTTMATLTASIFASWWGMRAILQHPGFRKYIYRGCPLWAFFFTYWLSSLTSHLNIGHRHLLPLYPVIFVGLGALGVWCHSHSHQGLRRAIVVVLLAWNTSATLDIAPNFLAYFNGLAGGPQNGWRHLVDSSLDWGQDLPGLKQWLNKYGRDQPAYLAYFGSGEPGYYSIEAHRLPFLNNFKFAQNYVKLTPGIYCISATILQQVYSSTRGKWTAENEQEYQYLRGIEGALERYSDHPEQRPIFERESPREKWRQAISRFESLRLARLCCYLRVRGPDDDIGHSILIFRLNADEIVGATERSLRDWSALIERPIFVRPP